MLYSFEMKKPDFSKKILKILSEKTAISLPELKKLVADLPLPLTKGEAGRGTGRTLVMRLFNSRGKLFQKHKYIRIPTLI